MNALESIFGVVLDASGRMACLTLLFLALRPLLRGHVSARVFYWVWIAVAIRLLIPFAVPLKWSPFNLARLAYRVPPAVGPQAPAAESRQSAARTSSLSRLTPIPVSEVRPVRLLVLSPFQWVALIWGLGVIALSIGRVLAYRHFARRLGHAPTATDSALAKSVANAAAALGVRGVPATVTDLVGAPALHGTFRPTLLFPPGLLEKLTAREVQLIVAHELGHCERRDLLAQAVIHAARTLHWFNPLIWVATRAARHDCELACDEHVVRRLDSTGPQIYGATLLKLLGMASPVPRAPLGLGLVESKQQIKRRIQMIIANKSSLFTRTALGCALLALVAGLSLTREARAQQPATAIGPAVTTTPPNGWKKNGTNNAAAYAAGVDRSQTHEGLPSAYVRSIQSSIDGFGGMMQMCSADNFTGKRLRFSAWMKTENANDGGAHLWFRVDGKERNEMLQFDNMDSRPVKGTTEWQQYFVVLDVSANASALAYGFFVAGTGQAWVSGVKIEAVGPDVASTNMTGSKGRGLPDAPVNLGFD